MWFGLLGPFQTMIACPEIEEKPAQDRKTYVETVSLRVAEILSHVTRQAPTKGQLLQGLFQKVICLFIRSHAKGAIFSTESRASALYVPSKGPPTENPILSLQKSLWDTL